MFSARLSLQIAMPLSLGLELEAIALSLRHPAQLPSIPSHLQQLQYLADALEAAGLRARAQYVPPSCKPEGSTASTDYSTWILTTDESLRETTSSSSEKREGTDSGATLSYFAFELISRVFPEQPREGPQGWVREVQRALAAIGERVVWKANTSTGLHIHVGPGEGNNARFTLGQLKRLAILACRFEGAIDELHPTHRLDNQYALSNRKNRKLARLTLLEVYQIIEAALDVPELLRIVNYVPYIGDDGYNGDGECRYFKVNFTSLKKHRTVEFRQPSGTTGADAVVAWADFFSRFVSFALFTTDEIAKGEPGEGNSLEDLRRLIPGPLP